MLTASTSPILSTEYVRLNRGLPDEVLSTWTSDSANGGIGSLANQCFALGLLATLVDQKQRKYHRKFSQVRLYPG